MAKALVLYKFKIMFFSILFLTWIFVSIYIMDLNFSVCIMFYSRKACLIFFLSRSSISFCDKQTFCYFTFCYFTLTTCMSSAAARNSTFICEVCILPLNTG